MYLYATSHRVMMTEAFECNSKPSCSAFAKDPFILRDVISRIQSVKYLRGLTGLPSCLVFGHRRLCLDFGVSLFKSESLGSSVLTRVIPILVFLSEPYQAYCTGTLQPSLSLSGLVHHTSLCTHTHTHTGTIVRETFVSKIFRGPQNPQCDDLSKYRPDSSTTSQIQMNVIADLKQLLFFCAYKVQFKVNNEIYR